MPAQVPTVDEFNALASRVSNLEGAVGELDDRVTSLEAGITPPDPPDPPDPPPAGTSTCVIDLPEYPITTFSELEGIDLGNYEDPRGRFTMTCVRHRIPDFPITVDFRAIDGWRCIILHFGDLLNTTSKNLPAYTVQIDDEVIDIPAHYKFSMWRWQSGDWPLPMVALEDLCDEGLLPMFDNAVNHGTARPYGKLAYVPMGLAGITPYMPGTGGRPDIGLVTDWQGDYICNRSATALANVLAQGEAGGTIPWNVRDYITNAIADPTSNAWKNASFYYQNGNPQLVGGQNGDSMTVRFTGTPGATIKPPLSWPDGPITLYDGNSPAQEWWCYGTITIGNDGWVDANANFSGGNGKTPINPLVIKSDTQLSAPTTVEVVEDTAIKGSGISIDISHEPAVAYLPFLLTGDPYFLEILQAQVAMITLMTPKGWANGSASWPPGAGQSRGIAWATRDHIAAAAVTPPNAPGWLLPRATLRTMLQRCIDGMNYAANDTQNLRRVFRAYAGSTGRDPASGPGGSFPPGCTYTTWQEDFINLVISWGEMLFPEFHEAVAWHVQGLIARVDPTGTSGWCSGYCDLYNVGFQDVATGPQYASWAEKYTRNAQVFGWPRCQTLDELFASPGGYDYPNGLQAALSAAAQAGHLEAEPALEVLANALEAGLVLGNGMKDFKWSLARPGKKLSSPESEAAVREMAAGARRLAHQMVARRRRGATG